MTPEERTRVCAAARSYLGVKWRGQGRDRSGVDCVGVVVMAFRDAGFVVDEGRVDYRGLDSRRLVDTLYRHCDRLENVADAQPADIVVYGLPHEAHLAILVDRQGGGLNGIHSPMGHHVVEAIFDPTRGIIRGIYRWRSLQ